MQTFTVASTLVLAGFLVAACDDTKSPVAGPTKLDAAGVSAEVTASAPVADSRADRGCRAFTIPLELLVRAGELDVAVTGVSMQFVSNSGVATPQTTLPAPLAPPAPIPTTPAPVPTTQFGSELIGARSVRTIPLALPIGCTADSRGTIIVIVGTRDGRGRRGSTEVRTELR